MLVTVKHYGTVFEAKERSHFGSHGPKQGLEVSLLQTSMHHIYGGLAIIVFGFHIFLKDETLKSESQEG